ncbi:hypothetical protein ABZ354_05320 [Streptomyces sp. NPDC005925]|uniref:hypothetical protein n=1 Tax=Streptomyces sp. NPDC005925 TaxID=3157172 RepID=UPI0033C1F09A
MDTHVHDRRRFLAPICASTAAPAAAPLLTACGAGIGGDGGKQGDGSAADDVTGSYDGKNDE